MSSFTEISPQQLYRLIGTPEAPVIVDVCIDEDFALDPRLVPGAIRRDFRAVDQWIGDVAGRRSVIACQKGQKLSQGVAALLRDRGLASESLQGGVMAWAGAGLPMVPHDSFQPDAEGSLWVTRHRPKIDRIACPWLIRRFVDPKARFLFVAPAEVMAVADRFGATPFDVEGVRFSHVGDRCSFDTMLTLFALETEALLRLATVVRGADTDRPELAPQSAGLLAISVGLSRMHKDDTAQLAAGMGLYDAMYRWARDGFDESHDWQAGGPGDGA